MSKGKKRVKRQSSVGVAKATPATTARSASTSAPKPTAAAQEDRVATIIGLIRTGRGTRREVLRYAADNWGLAERTVDDYLARARAELRMSPEDIDDARAEIMAWYREQYARACAANDMKTAIQAGTAVAKLMGLDAAGRAMLARAGLDSALKDKLDTADQMAADIIRQVYPQPTEPTTER